MDEAELAAFQAKDRLEKVASRLTVAFSIWALVVVVFGAGILKAQSDITSAVDRFRAEFTSYVIASEARLTRLEEQDKQSASDRYNNAARIRDLERRLEGNGKNR